MSAPDTSYKHLTLGIAIGVVAAILLFNRNCSEMNKGQFCRHIELSRNMDLILVDLTRRPEDVK